MTDCECPHPGWCPRHHCRKTPHWHMLCQSRSDYFQLWEEKRGPGQSATRSPVNRQRRGPCQYMGAALRQEECAACKGRVSIKVFQCTVHIECTVARKLGELACCAVCPDYEELLHAE